MLKFEDKNDATTKTNHEMILSNETVMALTTYWDRISQQMWNAFVNSS